MTTAVLTITDLIGTIGTITESGGVSETTLDDASDLTGVAFDASADMSPCSAVWSLGTFTLGTGRMKSWVVNFRAGAFGVSSLSSLDVKLRGAGMTASLVGTVPVAVDGNTSNYATAAFVPPTMTQAQIDGLDLIFDWRPAWFSILNLYEASVTVVYAAIPTANITYPTGTPAITLSSPTVTWTHAAGSDGGGQTYYQIKVFTAAQYGAGGFSADTSTAAYSSGVVTSSAVSAVIGPLDNSTTYRVYVRTAQTVNGAAHWSNWDFEGFTTNFTLSSITSVTPVATSASGLMTITVARNTGTAAWDTVEVERTDDGGATWVPVRGATNPTVTETNTFVTTYTTNSLVVVDYEAPNGGNVTYRARATTAVGVTGAWASSASTASWAATVVWLKDPLNPSLNVTIEVPEMPQPTRTLSQGVFNVIGATFPVVVSDVRRARSGTFVAATLTKIAGLAFDAALNNAVKLLQFSSTHQWGSKYIALGDTQEMHLTVSTDLFYRRWQIAYSEIALPADETEY